MNAFTPPVARPFGWVRVFCILYDEPLMEERVFVLIDGSNFYHRLKELELRNLLFFQYGAFAASLARNNSVQQQTYYIGQVRERVGDEKSRKLMKNQQRLFANLSRNHWNISVGQMLQSDRFHEKGVDVLMAVDLVAGAYEDAYDMAILVSSDTDLIPAIQKIRSLGKKITYVGFGHKPSIALIAHSDVRKLLQKEDLEQFLPPQS